MYLEKNYTSDSLLLCVAPHQMLSLRMVHQGESVVKSYGDRGIRQICIIRQHAHMPECAHSYARMCTKYARMCAHILKCGRMWLGRNWLGAPQGSVVMQTALA